MVNMYRPMKSVHTGGQMVLANCFECDSLMRDYESVVMTQARAENRLEIAIFSHDPRAQERLSAELELLRERRSKLRANIKTHQQEPHTIVKEAAL